jgi:serine/threonine protein kinase/tetratricopeptide (TPR) repeat protein
MQSRFMRMYSIHEVLGEGGMSVVYRATNRLTGHAVALKRIRSGGRSGDDTAATKPMSRPFQLPTGFGYRVLPEAIIQSSVDLRMLITREFETLATLHHPNIIGVQDYGFDSDQAPYFTMELLDRPRTILDAAHDGPIEAKVGLLRQLLDALAYVHRRHVLHRDLKPSNVLSVAGHIKMLDFGIATTRDGGSLVAGTVEYMAPEILLGEAATPASDLYSVGVLAYQLFTGHFPYDTSTLTRFLQGVLRERSERTLPDGIVELVRGMRPSGDEADRVPRSLHEPLPLDELRDVPENIAAVVRQLLTPTVAERYQSANDVIHDLSRAVGNTRSSQTYETREAYLQAAEFVGRSHELETLNQALEEALGQRGGTWLVGGESGVGKSRLLEELRVHALVADALVLRGQAVTEISCQYHAWTNVLRPLCLLGELDDAEAGALKDVVTDLEALLGRAVPDLPAVSPQATQARLFRAIETIVGRLPLLVVVLEDLQWAGSDSISLLAHLTRAAARLPLVIFASYRDDERPDLPDVVPGAARLKLERLPPPDIARLSASMLGRSGARPELVEYLRRETEGNLFFLVEVVRALAEDAGQLDDIGLAPLPETVVTGGMETFIQRRIDRVPDAGRSLLRLAAAAGRQLDLALLAHAARTAHLQAWLRSCADAAVLEVHDGAWRFAHDKLRERVLSQLAPEEARALHGRIGEALEELYPDRSLKDAERAHHFRRAERFDKALEYFWRAGGTAARLFLLAEARACFAGALEALSRLPATSANARRKVDTLVQLASVSWWAARPDQLLSYMNDAQVVLERLTSSGMAEDEHRFANVQYWRGRGHHVRGEPIEAIACYRAGLDAARNHDLSMWLMMSSSIGQSLLLQGHFEECWSYLRQTLEAFARSANWPEWCRAVGYSGMSLAARGRKHEALAEIERAVDRARQINHLTVLATQHIYRCVVGLMAEDWHLVVEAGRDAAGTAEQAGDRMLRYLGQRFEAWGEDWLGNPQSAERALDAARSFSTGGATILQDWYAVADADRALLRGAPVDAIPLAEAALGVAQRVGGVFGQGLAHRTWALALARTGGAWSDVEAHLAESVRIHEASGAVFPLARTWTLWAELCRQRGDEDAAGAHFARASSALAAAGGTALDPS